VLDRSRDVEDVLLVLVVLVEEVVGRQASGAHGVRDHVIVGIGDGDVVRGGQRG
jgi:hypothetical protein